MVIFWTLVFPLALATFFNLAFANLTASEEFETVKVALVEEQANSQFKETLQELEKGDDKLIDLQITSLDKAQQLLKDEKIYNCYYPTNRNLKNLIKNTILAIKVIKKEKPDLIISSGAAVAVPFFYIGKIFGAKLIYIEVFDRIDKPTLTGKLVYPITDKFIVQWDEMKSVYPKAINLGSIF